MALNVKQKYPGTQGGAAQLYASDTRLSLRRREQVFTRLSKSYKENMDISSIFLFLPGSVDATWRISSSSLRMCARQDCFVFERPQVVFYCNFSCSRHVSKSANLIGRIVFDAARQTKKTNPRRFFKKWRFYAWRFSRRCAHSHWRPLFSHEALNVGEYRAWNSSRCVRALSVNQTLVNSLIILNWIKLSLDSYHIKTNINTIFLK